jgi:tRNA pseudouridine38-40 synthase
LTAGDAGEPRTVCLFVAYDGAPFGGFVVQKNARTVAGEIERAISTIDPLASPVRCVSRTDAGVHARGQIVAFDTTRDVDPRGWVRGVSRALPREIAIVRAARAPAGFDPRRHVRSKTYRYVVLSSPVRDPLVEPHAWRVGYRLNLSALRDELTELEGRHDFRAFRSTSDSRDDTVRRIFRATASRARESPNAIAVSIEGDRFLHHMVRIIAGTLVDVARGRLRPGAVRRAIASGRREDLGQTAPARGLCLERVELDVALAGAWPPDGSIPSAADDAPFD